MQAPEPESTSRTSMWAAIVLLCLVVAGVGGFLVNRTLGRIEQLHTQIDTLEDTVQRTIEDADAATQRAVDAEQSARIATTSREQAEENTELARQQAVAADQRAGVADQRAAAAEVTSVQAQEEARLAREHAAEVRRVAEAETNRLTDALGKIAETRRTALGLVMSLDEGYLKFNFDEAELQPESSPVSFTPMSLGNLSSQAMPAITSTASAPPTPMATMPSPPALTLCESVPIIIPPGKA